MGSVEGGVEHQGGIAAVGSVAGDLAAALHSHWYFAPWRKDFLEALGSGDDLVSCRLVAFPERVSYAPEAPPGSQGSPWNKAVPSAIEPRSTPVKLVPLP